MNITKRWYESKTIWGSLVALLAAASPLLGINIDDQAQAALVEAATQLVAIGGSLFAVFGRFSATSLID